VVKLLLLLLHTLVLLAAAACFEALAGRARGGKRAGTHRFCRLARVGAKYFGAPI